MNPLRFLPRSCKDWIRRRAGAITCEHRLQNLRRAGFQPRKLIDAGAFLGEWSLAALSIFPEASCLMIEPQPHLAPHLLALCRTHPRLCFQGSLLEAEPGEAVFLLQQSNSRIVAADYRVGPGESLVKLPVRRLEDVAHEHHFSDCDFLKLDLQGHELGALMGAGALFGRTEVIQIEVSWLRIGDVPLVDEVMSRFTEHGYRPYDVFGSNHRPLDGALWQTDFLFVRENSSLLASQSWS